MGGKTGTQRWPGEKVGLSETVVPSQYLTGKEENPGTEGKIEQLRRSTLQYPKIRRKYPTSTRPVPYPYSIRTTYELYSVPSQRWETRVLGKKHSVPGYFDEYPEDGTFPGNLHMRAPLHTSGKKHGTLKSVDRVGNWSDR